MSAWRSALAAGGGTGPGWAVAEHGTSTVTWLDAVCMTRRAAGRLVIQGND
ncbi:MAG: hypothetical protein R2742_11255 [Micropruina glycogenica]